ncbi:MAG: hypothetical protein NZ602_10440, partial [Thermoguttaceae bacterium]|nr:hypothetical protein [Thermoguttaceae bacterium]
FKRGEQTPQNRLDFHFVISSLGIGVGFRSIWRGIVRWFVLGEAAAGAYRGPPTGTKEEN